MAELVGQQPDRNAAQHFSGIYDDFVPAGQRVGPPEGPPKGAYGGGTLGAGNGSSSGSHHHGNLCGPRRELGWAAAVGTLRRGDYTGIGFRAQRGGWPFAGALVYRCGGGFQTRPRAMGSRQQTIGPPPAPQLPAP